VYTDQDIATSNEELKKLPESAGIKLTIARERNEFFAPLYDLLVIATKEDPSFDSETIKQKIRKYEDDLVNYERISDLLGQLFKYQAVKQVGIPIVQSFNAVLKSLLSEAEFSTLTIALVNRMSLDRKRDRRRRRSLEFDTTFSKAVVQGTGSRNKKLEESFQRDPNFPSDSAMQYAVSILERKVTSSKTIPFPKEQAAEKPVQTGSLLRLKNLLKANHGKNIS
jgi:hypothetical protein